MFKRTTHILTCFLLLLLPTSAVSAQSAGEVKLEQVGSGGDTIEVAISWEIDESAPGYDLIIGYSGPVQYKEFLEEDSGCPAEVVSSFSGQVSLFCLMSPGQNINSNTSVGSLIFDITGDGTVSIDIVEADFGGIEVTSETLQIEVTGADEDTKGYLFENFTLTDTIWWLGGVCLLALLLLGYLYLTNKRVSSRMEQLVMLSLVGLAVLTGTGAVVLSMNENFDTREQASQTCLIQCGDQQCGPNGCGGVCGYCESGEFCSKDGMCIVEEPGLGAVPEEMLACEKDADCMVGSTTCCLCNEGGKEMAINKEYWDEFKNEVLECDPNPQCILVFACSGDEAVCENKRCVLGGGGNPGPELIGPPVIAPGSRVGDINMDNEINLADYAVFLKDFIDWKSEGKLNSRSDLNEDRKISIADYVIFVEKYLEQRATGAKTDGQ